MCSKKFQAMVYSAWGKRGCQAADNCLTFTFLRLSFQRSYCICCVSQLSGVVPKALESRRAISGLTPLCPFNNSQRLLRLTPRASSRSRYSKAQGLKAELSYRFPWMGRVLHHGDSLLSMVIKIVNLPYLLPLKPEDYTPVAAHLNGPETLNVTSVKRISYRPIAPCP